MIRLADRWASDSPRPGRARIISVMWFSINKVSAQKTWRMAIHYARATRTSRDVRVASRHESTRRDEDVDCLERLERNWSLSRFTLQSRFKPRRSRKRDENLAASHASGVGSELWASSVQESLGLFWNMIWYQV